MALSSVLFGDSDWLHHETQRLEETEAKHPEVCPEGAEHGWHGGSCALSLGDADTSEYSLEDEYADADVDSMLRSLLAAVYRRRLAPEEIEAVVLCCPEAEWLARCALLCPCPPGLRRDRALERKGFIYRNEISGESIGLPTHIIRFATLMRLMLHAAREPAEAGSATVWVRKLAQDSRLKADSLPQEWCSSVDATTGLEFWYSPPLGYSTWLNPGMHAAYFANACESILQSGPFAQAAEAAHSAGKDLQRIEECVSPSCSAVGELELELWDKWEDASTDDELGVGSSSSPTGSLTSPSGESEGHSPSLVSPTGSSASDNAAPEPTAPTAKLCPGADEEEYHTARSEFDT